MKKRKGGHMFDMTVMKALNQIIVDYWKKYPPSIKKVSK